MTPVNNHLILAYYDWIVENNWQPHIFVKAKGLGDAFLETLENDDGCILFNISPSATRNLVISTEGVSFSARFTGTLRQISIPLDRVMSLIYKAEGKSQHLLLPPMSEPYVVPVVDRPPVRQHPILSLVKNSKKDQ